MKNLYLDIAVYSDKNLNLNGVYACAEPKHGRILLLGYAYDEESPRIINLMKGEFIPRDLIQALGDTEIDKIAYNARFARVFLSGGLFHQPDEFILPDNWYCLKTWAEYLGYPKTLQGVLDVLKIPGPCPNLRALTEQAITDALDDAGGVDSKAVRDDLLPKLSVLAKCMERSLETTRELHHRLSSMPMSQFEWFHYWVSESSSDLGIRVDMPFLVNGTFMAKTLVEKQWRQFCKLTGLYKGCGVQIFRRWLAAHGLVVTSLSQEALANLLNETTGDVNHALRLWRDIMCNPVRKYEALSNHVSSDSRVRGLFLPNGGRLGEFAFEFFQADCVPICNLENDQEVRGRISAGDLSWIRANFASPSAVLARMLCTAFVPSPGMRFAVFNIQRLIPTVLRCLAEANLRAYASVAGESALQPELPLAGEYFPTRTYTSNDPVICRLYLDIENAIRYCLTTRCTMDMGILRFSADRDKLTIRLPSGHVLTYHQPLIRVDTAGFSAIRTMGLNADGKWDFRMLAGKDFVSDIVRGIARDIILYAMVVAEYHDDPVCLPFKDGVLMEISKQEGLKTAVEHVRMLPFWADDIDGVCDGYICEDYFKRAPKKTARTKGGARNAR